MPEASGQLAAVIRVATLDDAERLALYAAELFAEELPGIFRREAPTVAQEVEFISTRLVPPNSTLLVAIENDVIIGLLDFVGGSMAEDAHTGVFGLSVSSDRRGRGLGTALVRALEGWAPSVGVCRIEVRAWSNNPRALALYENLGFQREGLMRRAIFVDGDYVDVVVLSRLL